MRRFGYVLGGRPSVRILGHVGINASADTVLCKLKAVAPPPQGDDVRVLGVDDWAWRTHQRYGTMLMDLEKKEVVDLLPVRSVASLRSWLEHHPGVEVIARDRSSVYAKGGRRGAPSAQQVHDRFHLIANLKESIEADTRALQSATLARMPIDPWPWRSRKPGWREARRLRCREARHQRYRTVVSLAAEGANQLEIAATVRLRPETIAGWLQAGHFPEREVRSNRTCDDDRFLRDAATGRIQVPRSFSAGRVAALLIQGTPELSQDQRTYLQGFINFCPEVARLRSLALQFRGMLRWKNAQLLDPWLRRARNSGFTNVAHYAKRLSRDLDAVKLSISLPWNNGPLEGQINRLKVIKRQMYGRAGFALLRARMLPFVEPAAANG